MLAEDAMVERIARLAGSDPRVEVGIGDDAAVLGGGMVLSPTCTSRESTSAARR